MNRKQKAEYIYGNLERMFPEAHCQLNYRTTFELLTAVILSAQTTDVSVNSVTPALFEKYPDAFKMAQADRSDVEELIRRIGLYRNKAASIINMSRRLVELYDGEVPGEREKLEALPGVGRKTANVVLSEGFGVPAIAVDTHVHRVSARLTLSDRDDDVAETERKLMKSFPKEKWSRLHHLLIFFGRYKCKAQKPLCEDCPFADFCRK